MKKNIIRKPLFYVLILLLSGNLLMAQSKEQEQKAEQEAAMEAEMKARKEMLEQQEQQMKQLEYHYSDQARSAERSARSSARSSASSSSRSSGRSSSGPRTFVTSSGDHSDYVFYSGFNQSSQTQLTLRNSFDGTSNSSKGQFEVTENTRHFRVMINGKVKSGEIRIIVDYPNGDTFKDLVLNSAAEITFSQSVSISEEDQDSDKYIGDWDYKIIAEDAKGNYMLQIQTH